MDLTAQLDVQAFWEENQLCEGFTTNKPRCTAYFSPDDHWLFEFMAVPSTLRYQAIETRFASGRWFLCPAGKCVLTKFCRTDFPEYF